MSSSRRQFNKYPNEVLVETGTFIGEGIMDALDNGFNKVISFEVVENLYLRCKQKFADNPKVQLVHGSSGKLLYETIKDIDTDITFWLDGHYSNGNTGYDKDHICPILQELDQIGKHRKTHTILIDDCRLFRKSSNGGLDGLFDIDQHVVIAKLKEINPNYVITYENGFVPNDIIVAYIPK